MTQELTTAFGILRSIPGATVFPAAEPESLQHGRRTRRESHLQAQAPIGDIICQTNTMQPGSHLPQLQRDEVFRIFDAIDKDKDGRISFIECFNRIDSDPAIQVNSSHSLLPGCCANTPPFTHLQPPRLHTPQARA